MTFTTIDTLQFARRMQKAGLDQKVAEELAEAIKESQSQSLESLATKEDLKAIEQTSKQDLRLFEENQKHDIKALRQDIKALEHNMDHKLDLVRTEMEMLKKDIIIKLGGLMAVGISIIAVLIKF